jgi:hypothetical protein
VNRLGAEVDCVTTETLLENWSGIGTAWHD